MWVAQLLLLPVVLPPSSKNGTTTTPMNGVTGSNNNNNICNGGRGGREMYDYRSGGPSPTIILAVDNVVAFVRILVMVMTFFNYR
jgi:hypothetical protein